MGLRRILHLLGRPLRIGETHNEDEADDSVRINTELQNGMTAQVIKEKLFNGNADPEAARWAVAGVL